MDSTAQNLCHLIRLLASGTNRAESTVSRHATGSGDTLRRLEKGHRITTERAERAMRRLSLIWDDDRVAWPQDIPRPAAKDDDQAEGAKSDCTDATGAEAA